jgi:signal transduction histidine kinase
MKRLTTRLVILLMLVLTVITGVHDYVRLVRERDRLVEATEEDAQVFAETLSLAVSRNVRRGRTTDELNELLDEILRRPGLVLVAIYDPRGQAIAAAVASGQSRPEADDSVREVQRTREAAASRIVRDTGDTLRILRPFKWSDGKTAVLEVRQSLEGLAQQFAQALRERLVSRLVVLLAFVLSIVAVARWSIVRPIRRLIEGARAVGRGDLAQRIEIRRRDEIGELADEFNRMSENLQRAHAALLQESEAHLRLEAEVQQAQKLAAVGVLAAEVAHEVGTPLNVVSGRAEALARHLPHDHPGRRHVDVILGQTERITGIIRALLDYTRPRRPNLREESLPPLLARVVDLLRGRGQDRSIRIGLELPATLPAVLGDADQLQQLFLNLLVNAVDASPPGGVVRVTTGGTSSLPEEGRAGITRGVADGSCVDIHVTDGGTGLSSDQLTHVFEPFFSTKKRGHGTGLGLPIVEEIVRAHRGEVVMLSVPGRGTEVIVRLPVAAAPGPGAVEETASRAS